MIFYESLRSHQCLLHTAGRQTTKVLQKNLRGVFMHFAFLQVLRIYGIFWKQKSKVDRILEETNITRGKKA